MLTREQFEDLDRTDPLASFRAEFELPEDVIYLDGNSLGPLPKSSKERARRVVEQEWGRDLIKSWNKAGWFEMGQRIGNKIAGLIGADQGEVIVCDNTSLNLFKVLSLALDMKADRRKILMEGSNFPTDNYVAQGLCKHLGYGHEVIFAEREQLIDAITEDVAVVSLVHVHYKTGQILDVKAIMEKARSVGALVVWDLAHSAGAVPVDLGDWKADFAVGCGYKYLNGGPGAPAFVYVAKRHQGRFRQPLDGWWSHKAPFDFTRDYEPAEDIWQMMTGTQPILSMSLLEEGVDLMARADMGMLREKSKRLGDMFIQLVEEKLDGCGFEVVSPRDAEVRGSQVSLTHDYGYPIMQALIERNIIGDFRAPDILRFGFAPLYVRYSDIWDTVEMLQDIMQKNLWNLPEYQAKAAVT
ncbi:kynureninase [Emcibacter nanhaiensis]|uniref:Kynureninase n=1 Tax=Emcibacter nanhaiensis TaxID=1505037 RepID=A0A501PT59_9PROT|nr:kynureninase [Emcibacter nanhaiensis]TPD63144.1 kynureninase [Emcibacter nanhaiensis]